MAEILELISDAAIDTLKLLPFLYLTYLLMEFIEHKGGEKAEKFISSSGKAGPLIGSLLGVVPQCGFSAAAAGLYAGRIVSVGTLFAIFLSTSDEMLPIIISSGAYGKILPIVISKLVIGITVGFSADIIHSKLIKPKRTSAEEHIHCMCEGDHCHCDKNLFVSSLIHTLQIAMFIFIVTGVINAGILVLGKERLSSAFGTVPFFGEAISALIGLIPNCASSVIITNLYLKDVIGLGPTLAGLLANSGLGLLVLWRTNKNIKENLTLTMILYLLSVILGFLAGIIV